MLTWLVSPSNLLLVLGIIGLVLLLTRYARFARRLLVIGYLLFAVLGLSPVGYALILPLEERFPTWDATHGTPRGIIVLGGAIDAELSLARGQIALADAAERLTSAAELAHRYPMAQIVL